MGGTDPHEVALALVRKGHDPEEVRARLGIAPGEWSLLRARSPELDDALRGHESRLAEEAEAALAREARNSPKTALAYARHVEARKSGEARRRAIEAKLDGGSASFETRAYNRWRWVLKGLTPRETRLAFSLNDKVAAGLPFDAAEQEVAALLFRRLCEPGREDDPYGLPDNGPA